MKNILETILGAIVLLVAISFVYTAINSSGVKTDGGYKISANFDAIDGISVGSDVRIGGIKVGSVTGQKLNVKTYQPELIFDIRDDIKLPADSSAEIASEGLLGGKYVSLVPGAEDAFLENGDAINYTQSSINLEQLIGKFAFGSAENEQ